MEQPQPHGPWYDTLDPRQKAAVDHALHYAYHFSHAGVPGHSAHLVIAKLAELLDGALDPGAAPPTITKTVVQRVHWVEADRSWRDIETGVKVQL